MSGGLEAAFCRARAPRFLPSRLNRSTPNSLRHCGFTLLEVVVVLLVIAIVSVLLMESYQSVRNRAERTRCVTNLKNLFVALDADTRDQGHWPQCPFEIGDPNFDSWWLKELSRYNLSRTSWECPTLRKLQKSGEAAKSEEKAIDYIPCQFDAEPRTPYKWATQPWAVEIGDFHGDGNLILFPDGSIKGFNQFSATQR
jgi:prepilin-type N-terminal cleavage/methylation domain-containing protein